MKQKTMRKKKAGRFLTLVLASHVIILKRNTGFCRSCR